MLVGVVLGIAFGCIPGLTGTTAITLCLTLIYALPTITGVCLVVGVYIGGTSGGLISAILLNVPGTPASIATSYDGYPMAMNGQAGKALGTGIFFSFIGGCISFIALFLIAEPLGRLALKFTNKELFCIIFFALTLISGLCGKSVWKGLISAFVGFSLSLVGVSTVDGTMRLTMGITELNNGFNMIPALIGAYAITELIKSSTVGKATQVTRNYKIKGLGFSGKEFVGQLPNALRSSVIGTLIGILPGIGGGTSNILSYMAAKNMSKTPEKFGTGYIGGVVASETANNASVGGALIPMLTLGIPGDGFSAVFIGALMLKGLSIGPLFMTKHVDVAYALFAALVIANLITLIVEYFFIRAFVKLLYVPKNILLSVVMVLAIVGAFSLNNRLFDSWSLLFFGALGYFFTKIDMPLTPLILGFILGDDCESYLRIALQTTQGSFVPFLKSPICIIFLVLAVLSLILAPRLIARSNRASGAPAVGRKK